VKGSQSDPADISQRPGYSALKAVKDGRVYVVEDNPFVRSGPRLVQGLQQLAQILHPEVFKKNS
jgi:iron complex transport system substrate-binding protein